MPPETVNKEDKKLLERIANNDPEALEILFMAHRQRVYMDAYLRLKDRSAAWSVTTDIYSWIWKEKPSISPFTSVKSLLQEEVKKRTNMK